MNENLKNNIINTIKQWDKLKGGVVWTLGNDLKIEFKCLFYKGQIWYKLWVTEYEKTNCGTEAALIINTFTKYKSTAVRQIEGYLGTIL